MVQQDQHTAMWEHWLCYCICSTWSCFIFSLPFSCIKYLIVNSKVSESQPNKICIYIIFVSSIKIFCRWHCNVYRRRVQNPRSFNCLWSRLSHLGACQKFVIFIQIKRKKERDVHLFLTHHVRLKLIFMKRGNWYDFWKGNDMET